MGRTVICEQDVLEFLEGIPMSSAFHIGLTIGQFAGPKDYVIHFTETRFSSSEGEENEGDPGVPIEYTKITDIDEKFVAEHARTVTRMLSGGMWVLGIAIVSPGDIFSDKNAATKIRTLAQAVYNSARGNDYLFGKDPSNQILIFNFSSLTKKYSCKSIEMNTSSSSFRPAAWKFKREVTNWHRVNCCFNLKWLPPIYISNDLPLQKKFKEVLAKIEEHLDALVFSINNDFCSLDKPLNTVAKIIHDKKKQFEDPLDKDAFEVMFYEFKDFVYTDEKVTKIPEDKFIQLCGIVGSRVFLNDKAVAGDVIKAVKEDILRSLAARLEMHWQTCDEPEVTRRFAIRRPPRRIMFTPENSPITYSEYIFEGESEKDALATICENLSFEDGKLRVLEGPWDDSSIPEDEEDDGEVSENPDKKEHPEKKSSLNKKSYEIEIKGNNWPITCGMMAAVLVLVLSLIVHFTGLGS